MRLLWLADVLRAAGLTVHEVDGWRARGSASWGPILGLMYHATADKAHTGDGDRLDDAGAVAVIRDGRQGLPGPIATAYVNRQGAWYLIASGRCNTVRVGWAGPLKGRGNDHIVGVEAENDNRGEPWPDVQLRALKVGFAAILRHLNLPASSLAGHYEHQPYPPPAGETSTKTDPAGVNMTAFRRDVAGLITNGGDDMPTAGEIWGTKFRDYVPDEDGNRPYITASQALFSARRDAYLTRAEVAAARAEVAALRELLVGAGGPDAEKIFAAVDQRLDEFQERVRADTRDAVADGLEGGAAAVRAETRAPQTHA